MKYEEPTMQILLLNRKEIVLTSGVDYDPDRLPTGNEGWFPLPTAETTWN